MRTNIAFAVAIGAFALPALARAEGLRVRGEAVEPHPKAVVRDLPGLAPIPREAIRELRLSAPSPAAVATLGEAAPGPEKRLRIGLARNVAAETLVTSSPAHAWQALPAGGLVAQLHLTSPGAGSLRVGIAVRALAQGAELRFQGDPRSGAVGPVSAAAALEATRERGLYWSPVTEGDTQAIEIRLPAGADPATVRVALESASHLAVGPAQRFALAKAAAQSCHEDVVCAAPGSPALAQAARSVAKLVVTENGASYLCTGTLVNDADHSTQVPYLYTAAHCVGTQAAAATLDTFWFFEAASCGGAVAGFTQQSGGARLLYANPASDAALVRLADRAPQGAWFAGWDAAPLDEGTPLVGVHHPGGDVKKLAAGKALPFTFATGATSYATAAWLFGSTEPGSSGSGIFSLSDGEYLLRGGLHGGSASCSSTGRLEDPANRDYYSRLDVEAAALRTWLSAAPAPFEDFTDLWYDPAEPGWGVGIVQHANNRVFLTWYAYDREDRPTWFVMPDGAWQSAFAFEGELFSAQGSAWDQRWDAARASVRPAGRARIEFGHGGRATASFTVDGITVVKSMVRQAF